MSAVLFISAQKFKMENEERLIKKGKHARTDENRHVFISVGNKKTRKTHKTCKSKEMKNKHAADGGQLLSHI